jgi:hypothetical protein
MAPHELRALLRRQPFKPFRLIMSNGNTYDVVGPEWMMVTLSTSAVGYPGESGDGDVIHLLDNDHIAEVKPIDAEPVH